MEPLHAPWRIEYILAPKPALAESLFTRIAQSSDAEATHVIARDRTCYALLNTYPYTGGHLMVVPYKQVPDLNGLTDEELADLLKLTRRCQNALSRVMKPNGFNIGINLGQVAGAGVQFGKKRLPVAQDGCPCLIRVFRQWIAIAAQA